MKKLILISLLLSIACIVILVSVSYFLSSWKIIGPETPYLLALPIRFPALIYMNVLGFGVPTNKLTGFLLIIFFIIFDIVFYTLIFFGILSVIARFCRKKRPEGIDVPPEPPVF